jgi:hypothetical protein
LQWWHRRCRASRPKAASAHRYRLTMCGQACRITAGRINLI